MRRAVVTGGSSGLGAATAARLREDGLEVVTLDVAGEPDLLVDVTDHDALAAAAERIGPVDILINSAGIVGPGVPLIETDPADWHRVLDVNVLGVVATMRAFIPGMIERG